MKSKLKSKLKNKLRTPSHAVYRTPLLPASTFYSWTGDNGTTGADTLRARLREFADNPIVREALFLASPRLEESLPAWQREPDSPAGLKTERALVRYFARMATRCTPFGLFSSVSTGAMARSTALDVAPLDAVVRRTRLDNQYLFELVTKLAEDRDIQRGLTFYPNSALYPIGNQLRYIELRRKDSRDQHSDAENSRDKSGTDENGTDEHGTDEHGTGENGKNNALRTRLVSVEANDYLLDTLSRARDGALLDELASSLVADDPELNLAEAEAYIAELVDSQILVPRLGVWMTGEDPLRAVIAELRAAAPSHPALPLLVDIENQLAAIDADGLGRDIKRYREVTKRLETLPADLDIARLFQVDLVRQSPDASFGQDVFADVRRGIEVLCAMTPGGWDAALVAFRNEFMQRYGDREIPLIQALDEETGIGFDVPGVNHDVAPLLETLHIGGSAGDGVVSWGERDAFLLKRLQEGGHELQLTDRDLETLASSDPTVLCDAFSVLATVAAGSREAIASGQYRVLVEGGGGPSGARTLGRFCHVHEDVQAVVAEHLDREQTLRPDAVFAEIVHLPDARIANIAWRPQLREYEIPYLGISGAPAENQISVNDLLISVSNNRIVLRSERLGKEIVPRMTNAHNYHMPTNLGVYRFFCALQSQDGCDFGWTWGALSSAPFLPRVSYGRLVFSRARWLLSHADLAPIREATRGSKRATSAQAIGELRERVFEAVKKVQEQHKLPRFIVLADGDNELAVDLDNILSVDSFAQLVKSRQAVRLIEVFPPPDEHCAAGPDGGFVHELVVPLIHKRDPKPKPQRAARSRVPQGRQRFEPASEWLYAKLYTGRATMDRVLREVVAPTRAESLASGAIDRWFFIRYFDPDDCVRVRFHGEPHRLLAETLPALQRHAAPLFEYGDIHRIVVDTYDRETERYGGALGMELSEQLFFIDSEAVLEMLEQWSGEAAAQLRWQLALRGMEWLLRDMGMDMAARHKHIRTARESYGKEYGATTELQRELGKKFRTHYRQLERLVQLPTSAFPPDDPLLPGLSALDRRSEQLAPVIAELKSRDLTPPLDEIAWSYVHMHVNRLLDTAQRIQEFVLYDFLKRVYAAQSSRRRA